MPDRTEPDRTEPDRTEPAPGPAAPGATPNAPTAPATYSERLWPGPLGWALVAGSALAAGVILLPMHPVAAVVGAALTLAAAIAAALRTAARVEVRGGELRAGAAHIPVTALGEPTALDRDGMRRALGPGSDARAFVCLRAWIPGGVQLPVTDAADPTPSWLVSTRRPRALASAISGARQAHSEQTS